MTFCNTDSQTQNRIPAAQEQQFEYATLDTETRIVVQQRTSEIKGLVKRNAQDVLDIGQKLVEVKERLGHGSFRSWLKAEFGWSNTTAWNFMKVWETFKCSNFEHLDIAASALYLLATPSAPVEAVNEALELASRGEAITHALANELIDKHKPEPVIIDTTVQVLDKELSTPVELFSNQCYLDKSDTDPKFQNPAYNYEDLDEVENDEDRNFLDDGTDFIDNKTLDERELFQPEYDKLQGDSTSSEAFDRNGTAGSNLTDQKEFTPIKIIADHNGLELSTFIAETVSTCIDAIESLNAAFPSAGFYLGIQPEGFSKLFDEDSHSIGDLFCVSHQREKIVLKKQKNCQLFDNP